MRTMKLQCLPEKATNPSAELFVHGNFCNEIPVMKFLCYLIQRNVILSLWVMHFDTTLVCTSHTSGGPMLGPRGTAPPILVQAPQFFRVI